MPMIVTATQLPTTAPAMTPAFECEDDDCTLIAPLVLAVGDGV
jgi:hypothetical protein